MKRARTPMGWGQKTLGGKIEPAVGASFISNVEKGRKEALEARTVGRFRIALSLDEGWIDRFFDAENVAKSLETKAERDADMVIDRLRNCPDLAAERIVGNLREVPKGSFWEL